MGIATPVQERNNTGTPWEIFYARENLDKVPRYPVDHVVRFVSRRLVRSWNRRRPKRVLDLGCGGGRHLVMLKREGFDVVGIDGARRSLRRCIRTERSPGRLAVGTFLDVPLKSDAFDAVICYGVLYYGRPEETAAGIMEIRRLLKPGGWAFFSLRGTDDSRYGRGRELAPHCFLMNSNETGEEGMSVTFVDAAAVDALTAGFRQRFIGYAKVGSAPGRTDSDWLVEGRK
ncbi:MAG: class I SAM-dependent methyltransferase [Nitrospirae bacterium]|nr:class I SAM-dependent methyltransferase [Nitrospirota bacterium]